MKRKENMQCVTPLFRLYSLHGNKTIRLIPRSEVMEGLELNENNIRFQLGKMNAKYLERDQLIQTIPCNHCWACQLNKSAEWATRNMLETLDHEHCYFITLTYDDEYLRIPEYIEYKKIIETGTEIKEITCREYNDGTWIEGTLFPEDVKTFINSLRKHFNRKGINGIRYFYCGEYGETTHRPHYHILLYGAPLDLSENYSYHIDKNFKEHWKNPLIDQYWKYGMHDIANIEWSSAAYVSRYTTKKISNDGDAEFYAKQGKIKEYISMSTNPGIGMNYYENHKLDIYKNDSMVMKTVKGNTGNFKPPKSFDKLFKEEYPDEWKKIEKRRQECANRARKNEYYITDMTDLQKLKIKAEKVQTKMSMLPRPGEW